MTTLPRNSMAALAIVVMLAAVLSVVDGRPEKRAFQVCGRKLVTVASKICQGCIVGPDGSERVQFKKRGSDDFLAALDHAWANDYPEDGAVGRSKRGIVEECCYDPCTFSKIMNYCCE